MKTGGLSENKEVNESVTELLQVVDAKMAMKAGLSPILVRTGIQDHSKLNSFANKQLKRRTKIFDSLLDFADLL